MRDCIGPLDADMVKEIATRESELRPLQFPTLTGKKGNTVAPGIKSTLQYYYTACQYCWSSQFLTREWNAYGNTLSWWDKFTLDDTKEFGRGHVLIHQLQHQKEAKHKPLVFAASTFQQQFAV